MSRSGIVFANSAYSILPGCNDVIIIKRNEKGYYKTDISATSKEKCESFGR
jgi:hypothetical protein